METRHEIWVGGELAGDFTLAEIKANTSAGRWTGLIEIYFGGKYRPLDEAFPDLASGTPVAGSQRSEEGDAGGDERCVSFDCVGCGTGLTIRVAAGDVHVCAGCKTSYRTLQPRSNDAVFLVVPEEVQTGSSARPAR